MISQPYLLHLEKVDNQNMGIIQSLQCRECRKEYEPQFRYVCEECFGPLDVTYKFPSSIKKSTSNHEIKITGVISNSSLSLIKTI